MIDIYCVYRISYPITTRKKVLDIDLMYKIVIKKTKTKLKTTSRDLPSYAGLKQRRPLLII